MAKMVARIRTVIDVPFEFDIPDAVFQSVHPVVDGGRAPGEEMANENQRNMARIDAAKHAETELLNKIKEAIGEHGTIVDELVEEIRDAE